MSVKRAFFGIFQKIMVVCCAIFFGIADSFADNTCDGILNTGQWNQLMNGTTLSSWTSYSNLSNRTADSTNNSISFDFVGNSVWNVANKYTTGVTVSGHKYFVTTLVESNVPVANFYLAYVRADGGSSSGFKNVSLTANTLTRVSGLTTGTGRGLGFEFKSVDSGHMTVKDYQIFDLTEMFGAGNEPTVSNAQTMIEQHATSLGITSVNGYYEYNPGTQISYCAPGIKIATTAYNTAQFNPVVTDLNSTIATIRDVVTNTINQTKAIADLQTKKQTRPDEQCPAGKKCLLVEDNDGVPHWYEIIENIYGLPTGYTPLEYIESTGTQYIDTGYTPTTAGYSANVKFMLTGDTLNNQTIIGFNIVLSDVRERMSFGLNGTAKAVFGYGNGSSGYSYDGSGVIQLNRLTEINVNFVTPASLRINGTEYFSTSTFTRANSTSVYLMKVNGAEQSSTGRWYSAQIYNQNNELVRNFVPAKNSSGVIGMYDLVNDVFYTNSGTGTFTAGPTM